MDTYSTIGLLWVLLAVIAFTFAVIYFAYRGVSELLRDVRLARLPGQTFAVTNADSHRIFGRRG